MDLAQALITLRGLRSQDEFAAEVGVHRVTLIQWEKGRSRPNAYRHARRLVELGLDPALLLPTPSPTQATTKAQKGAA